MTSNIFYPSACLFTKEVPAQSLSKGVSKSAMPFGVLSNKVAQWGLYPIVFLFYTVFFPNYLGAQVTCNGINVGATCANAIFNWQCVSSFSQLLPPNQALTTPQYVVVTDLIVFNKDYTFAPGSRVVFANNQSGFQVFNSYKLTLDATILRGCSRLWAGVEVLNNATIIARNCEFQDAKSAIILRNGAYAEITGNQFRRNVCGIMAIPSNPGLSGSIRLLSQQGISGNTFYGNDPLVSLVNPSTIAQGIHSDVSTGITAYPYVGIWIERMNDVAIGFNSKLSGAPLNTFVDFGQHAELNIKTEGIRAIQSNVSIRNCVFSNFGFYNVANPFANIESRAIFARNDNIATNQLYVTGFPPGFAPSLPLSNYMFKNCYEDIYTFGMDIFVNNISSYKSGNSINSLMASSEQNPIKCEIRNSLIDFYRARAIDIQVYKPIELEISNNEIYDNDQLADPAERHAIWIENRWSSEINMSNARINNNQIMSRSNLLGGSFTGIVLNKVADMTIEQNHIFDNAFPTNLALFHGIWFATAPCNRTKIYSNIIEGTQIDYDFACGLRIPNSMDCIVNCNETNNLNTGMLFVGSCGGQTDISKNKFYTHERGLSVGHPLLPTLMNSTGLQTAKENQWFGSSSVIEAFALNDASASASIFEINDSDLHSDYWPFPRKIGVNDDNSQWFKPLGGSPSGDPSCAVEPPIIITLTEPENALLNGTYTPPLPYPAIVWDAKWHFSDRLNRWPALKDLNTKVWDYYQNNQNTSHAILNSIYQAYVDRWKPTPELQTIMNAMRVVVAQRFALDSLLSNDGQNNASLHAQMTELDSLINVLSYQANEAGEVLANNANILVGNLLTNLSMAPCTEPYELDMKTVLQILLSSHLSGDTLTAAQTNTLREIADKCILSGGYAVLLARGFFEPQDLYPADLVCLPQERSVTPQGNQVNQVILAPNPASESLRIVTQQPFENATLSVRNQLGVLMKTQILASENTLLQISDLKQGAYFLDICLDNGPILRKTFIKI